MDKRQQLQGMTPPSRVYPRIRPERDSAPENPPIDLARLDKATNGAFVVDWDLGLGA